MEINLVMSNGGFIETVDKLALFVLVLIDLVLFFKFIHLKKKHLVVFPNDKDLKIDNILDLMKRKGLIDGLFLNYIVVIKMVLLLIIIRMLFIVAFFCKMIFKAIYNNSIMTGIINNFVLIMISSILVIVVSKSSIQYIEILKSKLLDRYFR
jgi:hypothetical protein